MRQLVYYTLPVPKKHAADQRQDRLPPLGHDVRLYEPRPQGQAGHKEDPRFVLLEPAPQQLQLVARRLVDRRGQDHQRNVTVRDPLDLLAVPQERAADQLRQIASLQGIGRSFELHQRETVQQRQQDVHVLAARRRKLSRFAADQQDVQPQRQLADEYFFEHPISRRQSMVQQPGQQRVPPGASLSRLVGTFVGIGRLDVWHVSSVTDGISAFHWPGNELAVVPAGVRPVAILQGAAGAGLDI